MVCTMHIHMHSFSVLFSKHLFLKSRGMPARQSSTTVYVVHWNTSLRGRGNKCSAFAVLLPALPRVLASEQERITVAYHKIFLYHCNLKCTNHCFPAPASCQGDDRRLIDLMSLHFHLVFNFQSFIDLLLLAITPGYVIATRAVVFSSSIS